MKHRTSIWLHDLVPRINKAIARLNEDAANPWTLSSFIRLCIDDKLKKMGIK